MRTLEQVVAQVTASQLVAYLSYWLAMLAEARLLAGRAAEAAATARDALELAERHAERPSEAFARRILSELAAG